MEDRLISSEILKKRFEEEKRKCDPYEDFFTTNEINLIIDEVVAEQDGVEDGLNDIRTEGEWKSISNEQRYFKYSFYECSACHCYQYVRYHFCPNCGALMIKGEE